MVKVLVIGSGAREAAIVRALLRDNSITTIICAPGSTGIQAMDPRICIVPNDGLASLVALGRDMNPDLTVVGPEQPLVAGIVNLFTNLNLPIVGPTRNAARLEGSKAFTKEFLSTNNIPTAEYSTFTHPEDARHYIRQQGAPIVVKADGLAGGKGVKVALTLDDALQFVDDIMVTKVFGDAGNKVVIEECLEGPECSVIVLVDGKNILALDAAQDYKRLSEDKESPNTGGMGAYSPLPFYDDALRERILQEILYPTIRAMEKRGMPYRGILYAGLMLTADGPKVLEFNIRFGDPETQVILDRLESPLFPLLMATATGDLSTVPPLVWRPEKRICLVLAAEGYPGPPTKGQLIAGIERASEGVTVLHAGTARSGDGTQWVTNGGRVLSLVGPPDKVYEAASHITFDGKPPQYRGDVGT